MTGLFISILNMSITASYVALAIILVRLFLKKAPRIFSYSLWAVLLFRLICPVSFESGLSLLPSTNDAIPQDIVYSQNPAVNSGIGLIYNAVNQSINSSLPVVNTAASINPMSIVMDLAAFIWLLGFIILLSYGAVSYFRLRYRLSTSTLLKDNIFESDRISTPFVLGFFRPKIYIPTELHANESVYVIKHEQTHIKRRDYLIKPVAFLALGLHWFNPLMWISYFLMAKDMEMSCDESVLKQFDKDIRADYSNSLLSLSAKTSGLLVPLAFGESNVKSRIKNILNYKKPAIGIIAAAIVLLAVAIISLGSNPKSNDFELKSIESSAILFSTEESELLKIGEAACNHYYSSFMGENIPEEYRITEFELTDISLVAGDEKEFCVRITSDYSTTGPYFLSANGSFIPNNPNDAENGGSCKGNQSEFRIKSLGTNQYQIVSIGTGGGARGLAENAFVLPTNYVKIAFPFDAAKEHLEIDLAAPNGSDIFAVQGGTIIFGDVNGDEGKHIIIDHGKDLKTEYSHCSKILVSVGDNVEKGQVIAKVGSTGSSTGPHLSFKVSVNGEYRNPMHYLPIQDEKYYYANASADPMEENLSIIMSSPRTSSNPTDYIKAHQDEYDSILALDAQALPYLFSEFEKGGQTGLKGHIMERLCREILASEDISYAASDPQDWYDTYKEHVQKLVDLNSLEFVQEAYPKAALLIAGSFDKSAAIPDQ